jgi:hypothetical protein
MSALPSALNDIEVPRIAVGCVSQKKEFMDYSWQVEGGAPQLGEHQHTHEVREAMRSEVRVYIIL